MSQVRAVPSWLVLDSRLPSRFQSRRKIMSVWAGKLPSSVPSLALSKSMLLSSLPQAIFSPSGLQAIASQYGPACLKTSVGLSCTIFHICTAPLLRPAANLDPSGFHETVLGGGLAESVATSLPRVGSHN